MADTTKFPVVLEKDGVKRTAHSQIALVQLETQGFKAPSKKSESAPRRQSRKSEKTDKAEGKKAEEAKVDEKSTDEDNK